MNLLKKLGLSATNAGAYSGYQWQSGKSETRLASIDPSTGKSIAEVLTCSAKDYQHLVTEAKKAALIWRETPAPKRGELIRQMANALREHKDTLGSLVSLETGKSKQEGDGEVQEMIDMADLTVGQSRMLYGKTMHSERSHHRMYEQWHPYGIVGVITSFNFPVAVWSWNAFIAAVCGNVTLWKPSSKTPLSAIAVHHICKQVLADNASPPIFNLFIPNSHLLVEKMLGDRDIPLISFTGSTAVGKAINAKVVQRLGKTILELGGNNAVIVDESANLALAIPAIVFGALGTAGQRCTTTRRLFVHEKLYPEVLRRLIKAYQQVTIGPLIDAKAVHAFKEAIVRVQSAGGKLLYGGKALDGPGFFVMPTLVSEVENHWDIVQEETFAPILYVMEYTSLTEVIALHNAVPQGLSSALFTENLKVAEQFLSAAGSDCGIANINTGTSGAEIGGAFGGEKATGGGREAGSDAWKAYMRRQTNTINWGDATILAQGIRFKL